MDAKSKLEHDEQSSPHAPISDPLFDALGFGNTAEFLATSIMGLEDSGSWVFGLEGAWGSGKSSLINLTEKELLAEHKNWRKPVVIRFSPWLVGDSDALTRRFFGRVADAIDDINQAEFPIWSHKRWRVTWLKFCLKGQLASLASAASRTGLLATLSTFNIFLLVATVFVRLFSGTPALEVQRSRAKKLIQKIAQVRPHLRIVVVIDDLDRLEPREALETLRLVKAVADFPNVTYILAYDNQILSEAVQSAASVSDGPAYLEKIIQFQLKVPSPGPFRLRRFLQSKLQKEFKGGADWKSTRAAVVLDVWAGRLIKTPRDVVRIFEAVKLMWATLRSAPADLIDLVWLEMIKEKASSGTSNLFDWLLSYAGSLEAIAIGGQVSGREVTQENLIQILESLGWKRPTGDGLGDYDYHHLDELVAGVSRASLPHEEPLPMDNRLWIFQADDQELTKYRLASRFSSPWHWRLYSGFSQSENALHDQIWKRLLELAEQNSDQLSESVDSVMGAETNNSGGDTIGDQLLELINADVQEADSQRAIRWLKSAIDSADAIYHRSGTYGAFSKRHIGFQLEKLSEKVLSKLDGAERAELLADLFKNGRSVWALAELYRDQFFHFSPGHAERNNPYLSREEFDIVENLIKKRLSGLNSADVAASPEAWNLLYAASHAFGEKTAKKWFSHRISSDEDLIAVLESLETTMSSAQSTAGVPEEWIKDFADPADIKKRLKGVVDWETPLAERASALLTRWYQDKY